MRKLAIPAAALLLVTLAATPAAAVDTVNSKKLRDAVTVAGILGHERALQRIANNNSGTRASGTPGYAASAVSACRLTSPSAIWVSVASVFFSSRSVASSSLAASL